MKIVAIETLLTIVNGQLDKWKVDSKTCSQPIRRLVMTLIREKLVFSLFIQQ